MDKPLSDPLGINGGSPQGTLLGNLIFIVATSDLDKEIAYSAKTTMEVQGPRMEQEEDPGRVEDEEEEVNFSYRRNIPSALLSSSDEEEVMIIGRYVKIREDNLGRNLEEKDHW